MKRLQTFLIASAHMILAFALLYWSLRYVVIWTQEAMIPAICALFFSLPLLIIGFLYLSFGGYKNIPLLAWVGTLMMVTTGVILNVTIILF